MNLTALVEQEFNPHFIGNLSFQKETFMKINANKLSETGKRNSRREEINILFLQMSENTCLVSIWN